MNETERQTKSIAIQDAYGRLCEELDRIAGPDAVSTEWLPFVQNELGEQPGYVEWIEEAWEPAEAPEVHESTPEPPMFKPVAS